MGPRLRPREIPNGTWIARYPGIRTLGKEEYILGYLYTLNIYHGQRYILNQLGQRGVGYLRAVSSNPGFTTEDLCFPGSGASAGRSVRWGNNNYIQNNQDYKTNICKTPTIVYDRTIICQILSSAPTFLRGPRSELQLAYFCKHYSNIQSSSCMGDTKMIKRVPLSSRSGRDGRDGQLVPAAQGRHPSVEV